MTADRSKSLDGLPRDLVAALAARGAEVIERWDEGLRTYLYADAGSGRIFGRTSSDPHDEATIEHEAAVRGLVGTEGPLRAPEVLDGGRGWMLEVALRTEGVHGESAVGVVIAAAARLASLSLPELEDAPGGPAAGGAMKRRLALIGSGIRIRDLLTAKRILTETPLPQVTSHGDFHIGNVFFRDGALWVVDWEMAGIRSAGYDLMQFWGSVERAEDRDLLFEGSVEMIGEEHRRDLARLRYALLVRTIANKLGATKEYNRDVEGGRRLLDLLPAVRTAAH
jgi:Phosphotransferase enzyme family